MKILNLREAAEYISLPVGAAKKVLEGIPCIDFGKGRGKGKRWVMSDIDNFLLQRRVSSSKMKTGRSLSDLSSAEFALLAERCQAPRQ